ncbi:elongator complex protein 2, partial [Tremellales sp. Uapishka_1]
MASNSSTNRKGERRKMRATTAYISLGSNRSSSCAACSSSGVLAFGAGRFVALWNTEAETSRGVYATLPGHKGQVTTVKRLSDSKGKTRFVSGDSLGEVRVWEGEHDQVGKLSARSGSSKAYFVEGQFICTATVQAHPSATISALGVTASSTSGSLDDNIFTGGSDSVIKLWSIGSGDSVLEEVQRIDLKGKLPLDLEVGYLPGSEAPILVVGLTDRRIQIWTMFAGQFQQSLSLEGHEDWIRCLSLTTYPSASSTDRDLLLASGSQDNYVRLWRISPVADTAEVPETTVSTEGGLDLLDEFERKLAGEAGGNVQISTKAHVLAVEDKSGFSRFNITLEALLMGHESGLTNVRWSPSPSPSLLSSASDNSLIIWTPSETTSAMQDGIWIPEHRFGAIGGRGLAFYGAIWGQGGKSVMAGGWNGGWERWVEENKGEWSPATGTTGHHGAVKSLTWDPKQEYLISVGSDQTSRIHASCQPSSSIRPTKIWAEIARPQIHGYDMTDIAFIDSLRFASSADEKVTRVFDAPGGFVESLTSLGVESSSEVDVSSRPKGATVPPLGLSNRALGKDVAEMDMPETHVQNQAHVSISKALTSLPTEEELATSTLWPEVEKIYGHGYELVTIASSHSGDLIATACRATTAEHAVVRLVSTSTWDLLGEPLSGHNLTITRIAFSSDDSKVLTCSRDRGWRMYSRTGDGGYEAYAKDEKAHSRMAMDCTWSPAGDLFATASRDKTVSLDQIPNANLKPLISPNQVKIWSASPDEAQSWVLAATIKSTEALTAVDLTSAANGYLLAIGSESGLIEIHSISVPSNGGVVVERLVKLDSSIAHVEAINRLAWRTHEGGLQLASGSDDRSVRVFDVQLDI